MHAAKRITGVLLALACWLTGGGHIPVRAAPAAPAAKTVALPAAETDADTAAADASAALAEGLLACAEVIDLSACRLLTEELGRVYAEVLWDHPELFHVAPRLSFRSVEDPSEDLSSDPPADGAEEATRRRVMEVYPAYTLTGEALTAARILYRDTLTLVLAEMDAAFGERLPDEAERVLYLHDLLADRYAYDTRADGQNADAYTLFRDGVGICQAYALAFVALARGAGLEADFVASAEMDHAWNHVRVDGAWYHVDVTRDDPIPASAGSEEVGHARLLRSDEGMRALGYHGYACAAGHTCTDTRFETDGEADLGGFRKALAPINGGWLGEADGAPVSMTVGENGFSTGERGDVDGDKKITPADLLTIYGEGYSEAWRAWVREALVS